MVAVARDRAEMWKPLAEEEGVRVRVDVPRRALQAMAVPGALEQILDNLVDNSLAVAPAELGDRAVACAAASRPSRSRWPTAGRA